MIQYSSLASQVTTKLQYITERMKFTLINLHMKYLPPYSPFSNTIDNRFPDFKSYVKQNVNDVVSNWTTYRARAMGTILKIV